MRKTKKHKKNYILKSMQEFVYIDNEQRLRFDTRKLINYIGKLENAVYEMAERIKYFEELRDKEYDIYEMIDTEWNIEDIVESYME